MPLAYSAPTTLPALVPETTSGWMPLASSILITPMCANPLAAPPPSARPTRIGATLTGAGGGVTATGGGVGWPLLAQAPSSTLSEKATREGNSGRARLDIGGGRTGGAAQHTVARDRFSRTPFELPGSGSAFRAAHENPKLLRKFRAPLCASNPRGFAAPPY